MSTVDYTPVILAQLTDLQMRVTKLEAQNNAFKSEIERLTGKTVANIPDNIMRTSVPLMPKPSTLGDHKPTSGSDKPHSKYSKEGRDKRNNDAPRGRPRPKIVDDDKASSNSRPTMTLSDVLKSGEKVTIQVGTGKDSEGKFTHTTAIATFDGSELTVNTADLAPSLVGTKSAKPGEILYKFIDELKEAGHIKRTFTIAPWKLCFVERDGVRKSLEELRSVVG